MKKLLCIILTLAAISQFSWAQFYMELSAAERKELAEAYYLVGRQYESVGQTAKGGGLP